MECENSEDQEGKKKKERGKKDNDHNEDGDGQQGEGTERGRDEKVNRNHVIESAERQSEMRTRERGGVRGDIGRGG